MQMVLRSALAATLLTATMATGAMAANLTGAGATFPYPLYAKWAEAYKAKTGIGLNYQSIGSGGGIKQIKSKTVQFGASDKPLSGKELSKSGLVQFPTVMGGVVPVVNLKGIAPGTLKLDPKVLADIYLGKIKRWNDAAIAAANPGMNLPNKAISVIHRADGSGTTFIYTNYLSKVSPAWKSNVGASTSVQWPVGIGGKGNEGVAGYVKSVANSIGYVEYAYALQNKLTYTQLKNKDGRFVKPESAAFQAAAENANWSSVPGFGVILTDQPGAKSWPITGATFILMHKTQKDPATAREVLRFFAWAYKNGDQMASKLDYIPMPNKVVDQIGAYWSKNIKGADGKPVWAMTN